MVDEGTETRSGELLLSGRVRRTATRVAFAALVALLMLVAVAAYLGMPMGLFDSVGRAAAAATRLAQRGTGWRVLMLVLLALAAYAAGRYRTKHQATYGWVEVAFALNLLWLIPDVRDPTTKVIALLTGVYVFVRGLDNFFDGLADFRRRLELHDLIAFPSKLVSFKYREGATRFSYTVKFKDGLVVVLIGYWDEAKESGFTSNRPLILDESLKKLRVAREGEQGLLTLNAD